MLSTCSVNVESIDDGRWNSFGWWGWTHLIDRVIFLSRSLGPSLHEHEYTTAIIFQYRFHFSIDGLDFERTIWGKKLD